MRILIVGLNFHPELTGIGKYTGEMAAYLGMCHEVRVVTTAPYYPYWQVQEGYTWWQYRRETWNGMRVYRCPLWVPRRPSGLKRLLHLLSFAFSSFPVLLGQLSWKPDLVLCVAPAFFSAPFAWLTSRLSGAKAWLHIQDFELEAATKLGLLSSGNFLTRWAANVESWLLARFDQVSTISNRMIESLQNKGVDPSRSYLFPNWVDTNQIFPLPDCRSVLRQKFDLPENKMIVLYSGNMGNKQGLEILIEVTRLLRMNREVLFVLCGEGTARKDLENAATDLSNIKFLPLQPAEQLNQLLNSADIHILPQRTDAADLVMPSKLLGMLASGKPVIATAAPNTEIGTVLSQVGVIVPPGEANALCEAILRVAQSPEMRSSLGAKGRRYVCAHWSTGPVLANLQAQMETVVGER